MSMYLAHAHLCRLRGAALAAAPSSDSSATLARIADQAAREAVAHWRRHR